MNKCRKWIRSDGFFQGIVTIMLWLIFLVELYPIVYVISASFSNPEAVARGDLILWPIGFTLEGYKYVFQYRDIWIGYGNTIFYTVAGTLLNLAVTLPCAYALSRKEVPGRNKLMVFFMITMFGSGGLVPSYLNLKSFGLVNTRAVMLIQGALSVYNMIVARTFFAVTIPDEITEAARIDGCNDFGIFTKIVMPLSKAIVAVMTLYYGVGHWHAYFDAMIYLDDRSKFPLQMFLREILLQSKLSETTTGASAEEMELLARMARTSELMKYCVIIVATVPMMIIYPRLQRFFEKGVMIGSVKG